MSLFRRPVLTKVLLRRYFRKRNERGDWEWKSRIDQSLPKPPKEAATLWDPNAPLEYLDHFPKPSKNFDKVLYAIPRNNTGTGHARFQRLNGRIPGIVFDSKDNHLGGNKRIILLWQKTLKGIVTSLGLTFFLSRLFDLEVRPEFDSEEIIEKVRVLPRQCFLRESNRDIENVTFIRALPGTWLKINVPFVFLGEDICPAMRQGAYLNIIHRTCPFLCPVEIIPPYIEVDLSELKLGQILYYGNLKFHPALKLLRPVNLPILKLGDSIQRQPKSLLQFIGSPLGRTPIRRPVVGRGPKIKKIRHGRASQGSRS